MIATIREYALIGCSVAITAVVGYFLTRTEIASLSVEAVSVFVIAGLLAESASTIVSKRMSVSMSLPITLATLIALGPTAAAIVSITGAVNIEAWRDSAGTRRRMLFNASQFALSWLLAGQLYLSLGGSTGLLTAPQLIESIAPMVAAAALFLILNIAAISVALRVIHDRPVAVSAREMVNGHLAVAHLLAITLGLALSQVYGLVGPIGLLLLAAPLALSQSAYTNAKHQRETYIACLTALVKAIEAKDRYTRGHSERVARISVEIAKSLELSDAQVEQVRIAGLLHDIGKVSVPGSVLRKPARLDDAEYELMRLHPRIGADLCDNISFLAETRDSILMHHERPDGHGYYGAEESGIPVAARILAIADSYDAMTSRRSYRQPMSHAEAIEELQRHKGRQFDSTIVDVFCSRDASP